VRTLLGRRAEAAASAAWVHMLTGGAGAGAAA